MDRVVIVGAGFAGAETAAVARQLGVAVTLVDMAAQPMAAAVGPEVGAFLARLHRSHGVDLRLSTAVVGVAADGAAVSGVELSDGTTVAGHDEARLLDGDLAGGHCAVGYRHGDQLSGIVGIGIRPRALRAWRALVASRAPWEHVLRDTEQTVSSSSLRSS